MSEAHVFSWSNIGFYYKAAMIITIDLCSEGAVPLLMGVSALMR